MMSPAPGQSITINKPVMIDGRWTTVPHILTRGPAGLSDRPVGGAK